MSDLILGLILFGLSSSVLTVADASECIMGQSVTTSEIRIQAFRRGGYGERRIVPAADLEVEVRQRRETVASGKTDVQGYLRFVGLPPGRYVVRYDLHHGLDTSVEQEVLLLENRDWKRTIVAYPPCQAACIIDGVEGPLIDPPPCLLARWY